MTNVPEPPLRRLKHELSPEAESDAWAELAMTQEMLTDAHEKEADQLGGAGMVDRLTVVDVDTALKALIADAQWVLEVRRQKAR